MQATISQVAYQLLVQQLPLARVKRQMPSAIQLMCNAGLSPDEWQREVLTSSSTRILLNCSRQSGKSTVLAAMALHTVCVRPRALVLCVSPAQRQAGELFLKVTTLYDANVAHLPPLRRLSDLRAEWANRSRVLIVAADERRGVRGFSKPDLVIFDEAAGIEDDIFHAAQPLFAVHERGKFVLSSTPRGQRGTFYEEWKAGIGWSRWQVEATQCSRISAEFLAMQRQTLRPSWYQQEFFCKFTDIHAGVFQHDLVTALFATDQKPLQL